MNPFRSHDKQEFFEYILARFDAAKLLSKDGIDPQIQTRLEELRRGQLTDAALLEIELLRLGFCTTEQLLQEVPDLRQRCASLTGNPSTPKGEGSDREQLLAEANFLTQKMFREYELREEFARAKRQIIIWMDVCFLAAVGTGIGILFLNKDATNIIAEEVVFGVMGGFLSAFLRIYQMTPGSDAFLSAKLIRSEQVSFAAKPILGAVFAVLLHLLFVSQLINGGVFPNLHVVRDGGGTVERFGDFFFGTVKGGDQNPSVDYAKALVWSFIAGFAERFVPDALNRLANSSSKTSPHGGTADRTDSGN